MTSHPVPDARASARVARGPASSGPSIKRTRDPALAAADAPLGPRERAVLVALVEHGGRVVDRDQLRREAGLDDLSARRCEAMLVRIRRILGPDAIVNVRGRGWRLNRDVLAIAAAIISTSG